MFDMLHELAAIHRAVVRGEADDTVSVTVSRSYEADVEDVWDALTNAERLPRWFSPVTGDLRVGGDFQIEGNAGGHVLACEPPTLFRVTFGMPDSIVEVGLTQAGAGTAVRLSHTVPLVMAGSGAGALFVGPGWDGALLGLGLHLRGQAVGDPREAANSPEVVEFNRGSIERWTGAVESSGTATAEELMGAREAAVAQYTVVPS
jgi:uncharacterized protein YndB with AHSA1/START domain